MLKIAGSALVMLACLGYAGGLLRQIARHRDILISCMELAELLAGEIRYECVPVADALRRIEDRLHRELQKVLSAVADTLESGDCGSLQEAWRQCFAREGERLPLTKEELEEVIHIGENLGFLDADVQVKHLSGCRRRLGQDLDRVQRELEEKRKLYRSLGLAAGIFTILILL